MNNTETQYQIYLTNGAMKYCRSQAEYIEYINVIPLTSIRRIMRRSVSKLWHQIYPKDENNARETD